MARKVFLAELIASLSLLDCVVSLDIRTEAFTLQGRVDLKEAGVLEGSFTERTQALAIAWIVDGRRKGGIDRDHLRGGPRHPFHTPDDHQPIPAMRVRDLMRELGEVWRQDHASA